MLERLVGGPGVSVVFAGNFDPAKDHVLSALVVDGVLSLVNGGVVCRELKDARGPGIWYCSKTSRTC
jgi:hypothetical protein